MSKVPKIEAYDVVAKMKVPMVSIQIVKTISEKKNGGKVERYRLSGVSEDGNKLSRFISKEDAKEYERHFGKAKEVAAKPRVPRKKRMSCEEVGQRAMENCELKKSILKSAKKAVKKSPAKKASVKKASVKKASVKKASAKKAPAKKAKKAPAKKAKKDE